MGTRASERAPRTDLHPGDLRAVVARMTTSSIDVEVVLYSPGLCLPRHSHETAQFSYTLEGVHWSGYGRRGETCPPGTLRFLPAGEPHENHFPEASRCVQITVHPGLLALAAEAGGSLPEPGAV